MIGLILVAVIGLVGWTTPLGADRAWGVPVLLDFAVEGERRQGLHTGVDLLAACGTPVLSIGDGEVVAVTRDSLTVRHHGIYARFDHLAIVEVHAGPVTAGQRLGRVGRRGAESCHLHLAVRVGQPPDRGYTFEHPAAWGYVNPGRLMGFVQSSR